VRRLWPEPPAGEFWIGDDTAVVDGPPGKLLLSTDIAVAGVHADLSLISLEDFGWKALAAALSDIAAMGGRARHALIGVAAPRTTDIELLYRGLAAASAELSCPVVGGDLSTADQLMVAVTVTGEVVNGPPPVYRHGASPGDRLLVTGPLGASAAGLRRLRSEPADPGVRSEPADAGGDALVEAHRRPRPRLAEGETARLAGATAMIDVSDGLSADVIHLAAASGVGVRLAAIPVAVGATLDEALGGGEDYELVMAAADPAAVQDAFADRGLRPPLEIGLCTADPEERSFEGRPLISSGWEHPWELGRQ
jgi:thiamine-monophosphate kinase